MSAGERRTRMGLCALRTWASPLLGRTLAEFGAEALWAGLLADGEESTFGRRAAAIDLGELERATAACGARFLIKDALEKQLREKLLGPKTDAELAELKVMPKMSKAAKEAAALAEAEEMENATDGDN